jgi:2Fe-2S ferredoxin
VRDVLRSESYFQAIHFPAAFHIDPLKYLLGVAADAERLGVLIFEGTPATALDPAGVRKRVDTPKGRVRANHLVLAGGVHLGKLFSLAARTLVPVSGYVATTRPLGTKLLDAVRYTGAVEDTLRGGDRYRIVGDDRLLWGGLAAGHKMSPRLTRQIQRNILGVYPQLDEVEIEHAWVGTMGYAVHAMPQVGELAPGLWLANAFGGQGLNTTAIVGQLIAGAITDGDNRWRLFAPYELVWAGGPFGRAAAIVMCHSAHVWDVAQERLARNRKVQQARAAAKTAERAAAASARRAAEEADGLAAAEAARVAEEEANRLAADEAARHAAEENARLELLAAADYVELERERRALAALEMEASAITERMGETWHPVSGGFDPASGSSLLEPPAIPAQGEPNRTQPGAQFGWANSAAAEAEFVVTVEPEPAISTSAKKRPRSPKPRGPA